MSRRDDDLDRELRSHLEAEAEEQCETGLSPQEARYAARRLFGNTTLVKEDVRTVWGYTLFEQLSQDLRFGLRQLRHSPSFSAVAILTLGLGIGVNTAIFSVVDAVLLRPLPFREPERLVRLWEKPPHDTSGRNVVNPQNYLDWRDRSRTFVSMAALHGLTINLMSNGEPVAVPGLRTTPELCAVLGLKPVLGRLFEAEDGVPMTEQRVLLGYKTWLSRFGADPKIAGKRIMVNGAPAIIVGVLPELPSLPNLRGDIWLAWAMTPDEAHSGGRYHTVVARLKPGASVEQAQADLSVIAKQYAIERPMFNTDWGATVLPFLDDATEKVRLPLLVLLGAVGFILLIACANVANLQLMRSLSRLRELAVRAALGASKRRVFQQLLSESLLLALGGCVAGLAAGYATLKALLWILPKAAQMPRVEAIQLDWRVLGFAVSLSLATAVLFGLVPAVQVSRRDLHGPLKQGSLRSGVGGYSIFRRLFVVAELSLALLLLVGAGLLVRSFERLISVDPGFSTERLMTTGILASPTKYQDDRKRSEYLEHMLAEIRNVPGVESAGSVHFLPLREQTSGSCFSRADQPEPTPANRPDAQFLVVTRGYFETMHMPILAGRDFSDRDTFGAPGVVVVNEAFARRYFPGEDAIGKRLRLCWNIDQGEIAGVVANARQTELEKEPQPTIFVPNAIAPMYFASLVVRTRGDPHQMERAVTAALHRVDPEQAISEIQTMEEVFSDSVAEQRFQLSLLAGFAIIALALAVIGIYGVVAYSVGQRTQEIGIRMAIGAGAAEVARMVLREGLLLAIAGVGIGLAGALALTQVMQSLLYDVTPTDPATLAVVSCVLLAIVAAATLIPARRAARIDPLTALRNE